MLPESGDISGYAISQLLRSDVGQLLDHPLVVLEIRGEPVIVLFDQFYSHAFDIGRPDISHVFTGSMMGDMVPV
jgi:hypothetical protein